MLITQEKGVNEDPQIWQSMISISSLEFHPYAGAQEEELEKVLQQQLTDEKENLLHSDLNLNQPIDTEIFLTNESA